ncbi:unnamed protein product [Menidia menidia]|uniref:(Atlantic silverside) hypothetical protein n=1 Tax=Menidia menidia TaxID=238744 RepID=A0A8S4BKZ7_9TELE|nr:unnamed protein product [Menidia menidia]
MSAEFRPNNRWSLTMDEEVDPDHGNVNSVLAQESSELYDILLSQSPSVIMLLYKMIPSETGCEGQKASTSSTPASAEGRIKAMLEYYKTARAADCCSFLQSVCLMCENLPMHLESRLLSVAGYACNHWEQYTREAMSLLLKRWRRLTEQLVKEVLPEKVWVNMRAASRGRDRPDQTPSSADRGSRTPEPDGDYGYLESRLTLEAFLQGCAGKVTVLVGEAGSGKTLLTSCLGQQWANGLGPIPSSCLFVLLEFRQLSLLSGPLSLAELLFKLYLPPNGGKYAKQAIVDYLLSNPEQSCWVLDGYDEFHRKLSRQEMQSEQLDFEKPLPVADLISGLLSRQLLPGSTILVTCRGRDVIDLDSFSDKVGYLLSWGASEIKEYVHSFFGEKDAQLGGQAADLLLSHRYLLGMSSTPALCNICCICLQDLLWEKRRAGRMQVPAETGVKGGKKSKGRGESHPPTGEEIREAEGSGGTQSDGTNGTAKFSSPSAQVPSTHTQVYLSVVAAFLNRYPDQDERDERPKASAFLQRAVTTLSRYRSELFELSQLALSGLEDHKILFVEDDVPKHVFQLLVQTGLFSQVELRRHDGLLVDAYCFIHLTLQEFLAAIRIMTSNDVSDAQLKKRFSLKTRWTTKSDQKTVFTDSLYLYVCGLASPQCTQALVEIAKASGLKAVQSWVQRRQDLVQKLLKALCQSTTLTGPKVLQLCHCVQESQNQHLAKQVVSVRRTLELRNFWLSPSDIDALAFVVNSVGDNGVGFDFGACSMELECLDTLSKCQYIHHLSFHSRKYGDKFAEKLSSILPEFKILRKLEFCGASLTASGAATLVSGLQNSPHVTEINLSNNNLQDEGIMHIAEFFPKLQSLVSVRLGRNNTSLKAMNCLVETMSSCLNIQHIHADLLNQKWTKREMKSLAQSVANCPALSELDLSGGQWDEDTLRVLTQFVPKFSVSGKIVLNDSCSSVDCLVVLTALLADCPSVVELIVRCEDATNADLLQKPVQVSVVFPRGIGQPAGEMSKKLCLNCCNLLPADFDRLWRSLGTSSDLTVLDVSHNDISMAGVVMLAGAFCSDGRLTQIHISLLSSSLQPADISRVCRKMAQCGSLWEFHVGGSITSTSDALVLIGCLVENERVTSVELRLTDFCFENTAFIKRLLNILQLGQHLSYLEYESTQRKNTLIHNAWCFMSLPFGCSLSGNQLEDEGVKVFVDLLPRLKISLYVSLSNNKMTQDGVLDVASTLSTCTRVSQVEVSLGEDKKCLIWFRHNEDGEKSLSIRESSLEPEHLDRLAELVSSCPSLTKLELRNNLLQCEWMEDFVRGLSSCQRGCALRIHHRVLHLSLRAATELSSVSLVDCDVVGQQLASIRPIIQSSPSLRSLDLSHSRLDIEGAEFLCSLLPSLPNLTSLSLSGHVISDTAAQRMSTFLPRLRALDLSHCVWSATGGLQLTAALSQCAALEDLCLDSVQLNEESRTHLAQALRNSNSIRNLRLNELAKASGGASEADSGLDLLTGLQGLSHIQELEMGSWRMADRGMEQLAGLLPAWSELRRIRLSKNLISDPSGEKLLDALRSCLHLQELHNLLGDLTAARMALVLPSLAHLTVLDISENRIGREGAVSLSKAISSLKNLSRIQLTSVGTPELSAVAASLAHCPLVQEVGLGWNNCGDDVALELARVLPSCLQMTRIELWKNKVSAGDSQKLVQKERRLSFLST